MKTINLLFGVNVILILIIHQTIAQDSTVGSVLGKCHKKSPSFDSCMKNAFNELRQFFKTGVPEYNIRPFDPHNALFIELRRGDAKGLGGYKLILRNVNEYGWTNSEVTKYKTDKAENRIIYSQYFPEKSLEGKYEFKGKFVGNNIHTKGIWNLTLYDYSQTTSVRRIDGPGSLLKVHVEVDRIGGMALHISDFFGNKKILNQLADNIINTMWKPGLPFVKPLINELVSTAFTDIFNESFRYFEFENLIPD